MSRLDRLEAINAMARGFCHAAFKGLPDSDCLCERTKQKCHADLIYRGEAINAMIYLEKEGFVIVRRDS